MKPQMIDISGSTSASPQAVFELLGDSTTWPTWTPIDSCEVEEPGSHTGGEVRLFRNGRYRIRERIVERIPDRRVSYTVLSGLGIKDYLAVVDLTPTARGTAIRWHTTFRPKVPGFGGVYRRALEKATQDFVDGLVHHSAGRARAA